MDSRLWIAGHTKSGTTWLKFIVAALLYRTNNPKVVERKIPNVENPEKAKSRICKTHVVTPPTGKKLYIVRHPVDICCSGANHVAMSSGTVDVDAYVAEFLTRDGNTIGNFGGWGEGVENWVACSKWITYEHLLKNTLSVVCDIAEYVGAPIENIGYALTATSFKAMRGLEKKGVKSSKHNVPNVFYNPKHKGYRAGRMFINKGRSGYAREILSEKQIEAICDHFKDGMERVGYAPVY